MPRQPPIDILPIQIRPDLTVRIAGIPHDLTREEAEKIARVVLALVTPARSQVVGYLRAPVEGLQNGT